MPIRLHGGHEPEWEFSSHLGGRPRKKKKEGDSPPSLPVAPECRRGAIIITAIFTNNFTAIITNSSPLYAAV